MCSDVFPFMVGEKRRLTFLSFVFDDENKVLSKRSFSSHQGGIGDQVAQNSMRQRSRQVPYYLGVSFLLVLIDFLLLGVMGASLCVIEALTRVTPMPFKDLVPSLVSILKQIIEHRLPREYDYHRMPAPWMQMSILRILRILGKADMQSSQGMYEIVGECMKKADIGINAGYAVVYECIRTITNIYPNVGLLDAAAEAISRFISSRNNNLKYLGVTGLAAIVEAHPKYATAHQLAVMDCLESTDITLAHRTLELLYRMTNPHNVEFIIEKLILFLRGGKQYHSDEHLQRSLTFKIANLAERFAPSNEWYVDTITQLLEISGNIPSCSKGLNKVGNQLMQLIAEGDGGDEDEEFGT